MDVNAERVQFIMTESESGERSDVPSALPDGPLAAALLAAGIGAFALGLFTTLAEASVGFRERLILNAGVGPLSGKTVWATASSSSPGSCSSAACGIATGCCAPLPLPSSC